MRFTLKWPFWNKPTIIRATEADMPPQHDLATLAGVVPSHKTFIEEGLSRLNGCVQEPTKVDHLGNEVIPIKAVSATLDRLPFEVSIELTIEGSFFPAVLLCTGWWEGKHGAKLAEQIDWGGDDLKRWLFCGFEQWGPSCDINPAASANEPYLVGQIGERDEADSLLLVVASSKADDLRGRLMSSPGAFGVRARGFLRHPRDLPDEELKRRIELWGSVFNYCLFVAPDEGDHFARLCDEAPALYSGYLWQCWLPHGLAKYSGGDENGPRILQPPRLEDTYFLWEHTNFAKPSAVAYNRDSLYHKADFLRREKGELILVQKSSILVEGEQAVSSEDFYNFAMKPFAAEK